MRKILGAFLLWVALAFPAAAANVNIDALPAASSVAGADMLECEQGGINHRCTPAQVAAYIYGLMSGDATTNGTGTFTLATVNGNVGTFGSSTSCATITTNAKGLITAASAATCAPAIGSVTGLGTGVQAALGNALNAASGLVGFSGALGTPTSGVATNLTGTAAGLTAGTVTTNANLTGDVTSSGNATTYNNVVPAAKGGAGAVTGALKANGLGTVSQAACADLSNGAALCSLGPGTGVATALGVNVGTAGALVVNGGALGTPSSGVATNLTGTAAGLTAGTVTTNANLTGDVTSSGNATTYSAVVPAAKGGAGTITGALKGNGSGTVSQAACADLSNGTALCSTTPGTGVATAAGTALSAAGGLTSTIASGTAALGTSAVSSGACGTATTVAATNVATSDVIAVGFSADPTAITGYTPTAMLTIVPYASAGNVNFKQCNLTGSSITPAALTINWRVTR